MTTEASDADLVAAVAQGDRHAFDELYARHFAWLHLRLSRRCADPALVEEAIQDRPGGVGTIGSAAQRS